jgi:hypothetical protein
MKRNIQRLLPIVIVASLGIPAGLGADNKTPAALQWAPGPKSEFVDDPEFGRDPFFPASIRRPKVVVKTSDVEVARPLVPDTVVVKGISVFQGRKIAIINNYSLAEGEEFTLKGTALRIKCVEIKEKSVVVSANGAIKEIPLRTSF